ncbi:MAG: hypothetical protein RLZZ399_73 [Verrucomicrobiota bacterium]|jgi:hypothetical protein
MRISGFPRSVAEPSLCGLQLFPSPSLGLSAQSKPENGLQESDAENPPARSNEGDAQGVAHRVRLPFYWSFR